MTLKECEQEREQLMHTQGITVSKIGFVCTGGFDFEDTHEFKLVDGDCLYQESEPDTQ